MGASDVAQKIKVLAVKYLNLLRSKFNSQYFKWKERTNSCKQSSNFYTDTVTCTCPSPNKCNKNLKVEDKVN